MAEIGGPYAEREVQWPLHHGRGLGKLPDICTNAAPGTLLHAEVAQGSLHPEELPFLSILVFCPHLLLMLLCKGLPSSSPTAHPHWIWPTLASFHMDP